MKITRYLFLAGVFVITLFISRSISLEIFHPNGTYTPDYSIYNQVSPVTSVPITQQLNILLIQVDGSVTPKPVGIWWIAIAPETQITLVSLYPNNELGTEQWITEFSLINGSNQSKQVAPNFLEKIEHKNIPWDGYMVLEPTAVEILVNSFGGIQINGEVMEGAVVTQNLLSLTPNSIEGRAFQTDVWSRLCQKALFAGSSGIYNLVKDELAKHTITSPDFPISFSDFQTLINTSNLTKCEVNLLKSENSIDLAIGKTNEGHSGRNNGY